jgi:hypothetical protein
VAAGAAPVDLKELHAKIGQLALENDFWLFVDFSVIEP